MKSFLVWLGKKIISGIFIALFSILTVLGIVYAVAYPNTPPAGEIVGWKFATVLNNILQSGNYATDTSGTVRNSAKLWGLAASSYLTAETDPQVGSLVNGKWCKASGGQVDCTVDAPIGGVVYNWITYGNGAIIWEMGTWWPSCWMCGACSEGIFIADSTYVKPVWQSYGANWIRPILTSYNSGNGCM